MEKAIVREEMKREKFETEKSQEVRLSSLEGGRLLLEKDGKEYVVELKRCFPWSFPLSHFVLCNDKDEEVHLIKEVNDLDEESQKSLHKALEEAGFCFVIRDLVKVEEDFELRHWDVETSQGPRSFQTQLLEWPREVPGGGLLIQDVAGDIYFVADLEKLPERGKNILWAFLD